MAQTKNALFLVAGGGFQWESLTLADQLCNEWSCTFVLPESSVYPDSETVKRIAPHRFITLPEFSSRSANKFHLITKNFFNSILLLINEFKTNRPDAAICVGSSMAIPIAVVCFLKNVRMIFIESITRTNSLSSTGKLLLALRLVDNFYVQWPEQEHLHPEIRYKGTVL